jgi:hypothetical protein
MVGLLAGAWELTSLLQVGNTLELVRQKPCDGKANARYRPRMVILSYHRCRLGHARPACLTLNACTLVHCQNRHLLTRIYGPYNNNAHIPCLPYLQIAVVRAYSNCTNCRPTIPEGKSNTAGEPRPCGTFTLSILPPRLSNNQGQRP